MYQLHRRIKKKIRITSKIRLAIFISLLLIIIYPAILLAIEGSPEKKSESFVNVYIEPGDTLWDIAKSNMPPDTDIRDFVNRIKTINKLDSGLIRAGESLFVPTNP